MTHPNEPAMPTFEYDPSIKAQTQISIGLTKREELAKAAMQGIAANPELVKLLRVLPESQRHQYIAETALKTADALIAALNANPSKQ